MIAAGAPAPDFVGTAADGSRIDSSTFRGRPLILYFYPKANTTGCTMEARGFSEHYSALEQAGIAVVGVSVDTVEEQKRFAESCEVPFPLVADRERSISKLYGVLGLFGIAKRVTFFIDAKGTVTEVVQGMMPGPHVRRAVELARAPNGPDGPTQSRSK